MAVVTAGSLSVPALGATGTVTTSNTSGSGLVVGGFVDLFDGVNEVIGVLITVGSTSISFLCLEVRSGVVGNTFSVGGHVRNATNADSVAVAAANDIDWSTYSAGYVLTATPSNGKTFSWVHASGGAVTLAALTDIDQSTQGAGKVLTDTASGGHPFSFQTPSGGGGGVQPWAVCGADFTVPAPNTSGSLTLSSPSPVTPVMNASYLYWQSSDGNFDALLQVNSAVGQVLNVTTVSDNNGGGEVIHAGDYLSVPISQLAYAGAVSFGVTYLTVANKLIPYVYASDGTRANNAYHIVVCDSGGLGASDTSTSVVFTSNAVFTTSTYDLHVWDTTSLVEATVTAQSPTGFTFTSVSGHDYAYTASGI
jgi:hypothetical protein